MPSPLPLTSAQQRSIDCWKRYATGPELTRLWSLIAGRPPRQLTRAALDPLTRYCPHAPWPRQREFLSLDCLEAFYGGAAAGGKSDALLMAALMYVDRPGYAALLVRKDTQRLRLAGGLIPRAHQWLAGTEARWRADRWQWRFPTAGAPATLTFGHLHTPAARYRYGGSEFQFIGFDELTELAEDDYLFLFSRLRRSRGVDAPLRMRAASNPGGMGLAWVRRRFIPDEALAAADAATVFWRHGAAYVPARIADNPAIDEAEYRGSLAHLPTVLRERLMHGDWSVHEAGLIRPDWLRYYVERGERLELLAPDGGLLATVDPSRCRRLATIDPAGTSAQRAREARGRPPSWSVIEVWDLPPPPLDRLLILRHVWRRRVGFDGLCHALADIHRQWRPTRMLIENEKLGQAAIDLLGGALPLVAAPTGGRDKVARAAPLIARLERGEVFLPKYDTAWRPAFESELLAWTGHPDETADQLDAAAYAADATLLAGLGPLRIEPLW